MLNYHLLNHCTNCGSKRIKVKLEELPEDIYKEVEEFKVGDYFLHCEVCNGYSLIFE